MRRVGPSKASAGVAVERSKGGAGPGLPAKVQRLALGRHEPPRPDGEVHAVVETFGLADDAGGVAEHTRHHLALLWSEHVGTHGVCGDKGWLFVGDRGNPPHQNTVGYWWRKTLGGAGLSGIGLHDLRHFYAPGLIAAGCDVVTVQRALRHARATTLNADAHLWPTA